MESIAEVAATKEQTAFLIDLWQAALGGDSFRVEARVFVNRITVNLGRVDFALVVDADKYVLIRIQILKAVHPVVSR